MRKAVVLIVVLFVIALALALVLGRSLAVTQRIAHVSNPVGTVLAKIPRATDFAPLQQAQNVLAGTVLKTGPASSLTLNWIDGTRLKVGPETIMTVLKCQINHDTGEQVSLFRLDVGEIWVRVRKLLSRESKFEIRTPTATAGVRGTVFVVRVTPEGDTEVVVLEGKVHVSAGGQKLAVTPGAKAVAAAQAVEVQQLSPDEQATWQQPPDLQGPYLKVTQPLPGASVTPGPLRVRGQVEENAQITVNGQSVVVSDLHRFTATVDIPPEAQIFVVWIVATDEQGAQTEVITEVQVSPAADLRNHLDS